MKIKLLIAIITITFIQITALSKAQDFHLSHYDAHPLYLNPALTGLRISEDWDFRINANYREQTSNLGKPYTTIASGFDMPVAKKFSIGEFITNNKGANGSFNTFNAMLSGSYQVTGNASPHNISVGLQLGILQKSFHPVNFVYDSQYSTLDPDGFDENLPSGENFNKESFFRLDANIGMYYRFFNENKKYSPFAGFSVYHLTRSDESFSVEKSSTPMRFTIHGGCYFVLNEHLRILPQVLYMNQAKATELNAGILAFYKIGSVGYEPVWGFSWKNKDAVVLHLGLKLKSCIFRVSYDVNISYLKKYNNSALELSLIYTAKKKNTVAMDSEKK